MIVTAIREQPKPLPKPPVVAVTIELTPREAIELEAVAHYYYASTTSGRPLNSFARKLVDQLRRSKQ